MVERSLCMRERLKSKHYVKDNNREFCEIPEALEDKSLRPFSIFFFFFQNIEFLSSNRKALIFAFIEFVSGRIKFHSWCVSSIGSMIGDI
ncbi:hypothetical protein IMY05_019G0036200 [Salix suchowensis]|nr:hypothetical protein IMY05_019G0036200 [Salix suchowensis]